MMDGNFFGQSQFWFASDATRADQKFVTVTETEVEVHSLYKIPLADALPLSVASLELVDQPVDGVTDTEKELDTSGKPVLWDPDARTIKLGTVVYSEALARSLAGALDFYFTE